MKGNETKRQAHQAGDFAILKTLLDELYPETAEAALKRPLLLGPDPHSFHASDSQGKAGHVKYLADFIDAAVNLSLPMHAITHHEYLLWGERLVDP